MLRTVGCACFVLAAGLGQSQPVSAPAFDVASIKPNNSGARNGGIGLRTGRFDATNATLKQLIAEAYGIRAEGVRNLGNRIVGGPGWVATERYNVAARAEPPVSGDTLRAMARRMLEERFQLKVHSETREMPIYALVIGKNGPKFKPSGAEAEAGVSQGAVQGKYRVTAHKMPIFVLASMLENQMDRIVMDRTGLDGLFDFQLEWALDLNANAADVSAPSVFSALQEQLGLKLESTKGPVEVIVIERVEKPSEN